MSKQKYFWILLAAVRIGLLLTPLCPNWSYIQPDQFFQSTEPIAGDIFETEVLLVWEFNASFPMRNIFFPQLIARPVFSLIKSSGLSDSPRVVFFGPRIVITLLSFICDYSLYKLCQLSHKSSSFMMSSLIVFSSSYISTTYLTQTFSNTIETILVSLLLVNVFKSISTNYYNFCNSFIIGSILAFGFFNRPTFVLFAMSPLIFWGLSHGFDGGERTATQMVMQLIRRGLSLMTSFIMISMSLIFVDTLYYNQNGFQIFQNLINYRFEELFRSLVITPLNFAIYNTKTSNLANHGLHPPYFHVLVSVPMAFSLLGLFAYFDFFQKTKQSIKWLFKPTTKPVLNVFEGLCLLTFIIPLLGFSLIPHQEPRFLIPCVVPLCYLYANRLISRKYLFIVWIVVNIILMIFYAFIHQSGVIRGVLDLNQIIDRSGQKSIDIIFCRHYLPPRHLLNIPKNTPNIRIHDLSVLGLTDLDAKLNQIKVQNVTEFYLMIPSCLTEQLNDLFTRHGIQEYKYKLVKQYFPHFTGEDIENSINLLTTSFHFESIKNAFALNIWKVLIK